MWLAALWFVALGFVGGLAGCESDDPGRNGLVAPDLGTACAAGEVRPCAFGGECVGRRVCEGGHFGACARAIEVCNGEDDDCDEAVDEGFLTVGEVCSAGEGACRGEGVVVCEADGSGVVCDAVAGVAGVEGCDGVDEDCDGTVDEGVAAVACAVGVGACRVEGTAACLAGEWVCDRMAAEPVAEGCNGIDDDCDDRVDEDAAEVGSACETDAAGICAAGRVVCDAGEVACRAVTAGGDEACNGLDDDCDGSTDELYAIGERCIVGVGACAAEGLMACDDRGEARCEGVAGMGGEERCNGLDDDCDGMSDEGFGVGEGCALGVGACRVEGVMGCEDEVARCLGVVGAGRDEVCNDIDDDCDGTSDEGLGIGAVCEVGLGACLRVGAGVCGEEGALWCDAVAGEPGVEACNDIDDDCDGTVDEGIGVGEVCRAGVGICEREGRLRCDDGGGTRCDAEPGAGAVETCNALDDDCDGQTDEQFPVGEACVAGLGECRESGAITCAGGGQRCDAVPAAPENERCNALDDDCDGRSDEQLGVGTACTVGVGACLRAAVVGCRADAAVCLGEAGAPGVERCEGSDEDCDGRVDEGFGVGAACTVGVGACARAGVRVCAGGEARCDAVAGDAGPELCNGSDDDCDGRHDEVASCVVYRSCEEARAAGVARSGTYLILDSDGLPRSAWCEMGSDGGGWTLVASSRGAPPADARGAWHVDLQSPVPAAAHPGVWAVLRNRTVRHDVRFICHVRAGAVPTVDLSFYNVTWYREFTTGSDADCCFSEADGRGAAGEAEARRDNLSETVRAVGQGRAHAEGDWFEGEDACGSVDDFAVDFDGRALGEPADATDWGLFDGIARCGAGVVAVDARWSIYAREPRTDPLGTIGILGPAQIGTALVGSGFASVVVNDDPLPDLSPYAAVFFGRYATDWAQLPVGLEVALDVYNRTGGSIVTEYDGVALLGRGYAADFAYAAGAPAPWDWFPWVTGGGGFVGLLPLRAASADPILRSLPDPFSGRAGPGFFFRPELAGNAAVRRVTLTTVGGAEWVSTFRAVRCRGNVIVGTGSYADGAREADVGQYIRNLAATAASPAPGDLPDLCP